MSTTPSLRTWTVNLPWSTPPLNLNRRMHWAQRGRITAEIRGNTKLLVKAANIPPMQRITVTLHYLPKDRRRRDTDNLTDTLKPTCDGIVDAGIVPDDTPTYMHKNMPEIHQPDPAATTRIWLEIQEAHA